LLNKDTNIEEQAVWAYTILWLTQISKTKQFGLTQYYGYVLSSVVKKLAAYVINTRTYFFVVI